MAVASERGLTLVEMLLVLFLIGLIAKITVPTTTSDEVAELENAESFLLEAFRFARLEAMRKGLICGVNIDTSAKRLRLYRYDDTQSTMAGRKYYTVDSNNMAKNGCLMHPDTKLAFDITYGSGTDYPKLVLTYNQFRGASGLVSNVYRTGDIQFDGQGFPYVFNGANEPVPLTAPSPSTSSPVEFAVGGLAPRGLTICPQIGKVVIKRLNKDAADPCSS